MLYGKRKTKNQAYIWYNYPRPWTLTKNWQNLFDNANTFICQPMAISSFRFPFLLVLPSLFFFFFFFLYSNNCGMPVTEHLVKISKSETEWKWWIHAFSSQLDINNIGRNSNSRFGSSKFLEIFIVSLDYFLSSQPSSLIGCPIHLALC